MDILKCAVFIGVPDGNASIESMPVGAKITADLGGTGFFLWYQSDFISNASYLYLVTARHVAEKTNAKACVVHANLVSGDVGMMVRNDPQWHVPEDESIDLAVLLWEWPVDFDVKLLTINSLLTHERLISDGYGPGDTAVAVGMFIHARKTQSVMPITRKGSIAMIPNEPLKFEERYSELYLIELLSTGGLSGSPVFLTEPSQPFMVASSRFQHPLWLLGVVSGHYNVELASGSVGNTGIAAVVPAGKIIDLLKSPPLVEQRRVAEGILLRGDSPLS